MESVATVVHREPWNKGKIVGQKAPFKLKDVWALRVRLQMEDRVRELTLFNLGIDSKLRGCDLVSLKVRDVCHGDQVASRAVVMCSIPDDCIDSKRYPLFMARSVMRALIEQLKAEARGVHRP